MEQQQSTKNTVSDRMSRVFTKKRTLGLAACLALVLIAGGGASYYHHAQERAAHAQERAALSELTAIQAEKMGVSVLSEAEIRSIAADAIGQEETAVTFDEISLMTGAPGEHFGKHGDKERVEHRKDQQDKHQKAHEGRDEALRAAPPDERSGAPDGADGAQPWHHGADGEAEHPGAPDGQPMKSGMPGGAPPQAPTDNAAPKNAQVHEEGQPPLPPEGAEAPQARGEARSAGGQPPFGAPSPQFTYLVHCTAGGMHYTLAIDAVHGTVLPQGVRAAR